MKIKIVSYFSLFLSLCIILIMKELISSIKYLKSVIYCHIILIHGNLTVSISFYLQVSSRHELQCGSV